MVYLTRYSQNPILKREPYLAWARGSVLNPSVWYENGLYRMVFRATNDVQIDRPGGYISTIGYAESIDGVNFKIRPEPVIVPDQEYEENLGCEDPRLTKIDDTYYLYYTAVGRGNPKINNGWVVRIALATSKDFVHWTKHGIVGPKKTSSKAACLFPEKINGKYIFLYTLIPDNPNSSILISELDNLGEVLDPPNNKVFDFIDAKGYEENVIFKPSVNSFRGPEVGAVPIKTKWGWLLIYCPENKTKGPLWAIGAALLDLENPRKVLGISKEPILRPELELEKTGVVNNVTFPEGAVIKNTNGQEELYVYYGSADQGICLATCNLKMLIDDLLQG